MVLEKLKLSVFSPSLFNGKTGLSLRPHTHNQVTHFFSIILATHGKMNRRMERSNSFQTRSFPFSSVTD